MKRKQAVTAPTDRAKRNGKAALGYIPCRVAPGMFREEWLVFVDALNPKDPNEKVPVQLLVDRREVAGIRGTPQDSQPADGWLCVSVVGHQGDLAEIVLPQPSQPLGENVLVAEKSVKREPGT
jgi:hypothetical protein